MDRCRCLFNLLLVLLLSGQKYLMVMAVRDDEEVISESSAMNLFVALLAVLAGAYYMSSASSWWSPPNATLQQHASAAYQYNVPFIVCSEPDWKILNKSYEAYQRETHQALEQLSVALEVLVTEEERVHSRRKISDLLRDKIERLSRLYDKDLEVVRQVLLVPFPVTFVLPSTIIPKIFRVTSSSHVPVDEDTSREHVFAWNSQRRQTLEQQRPYDSARQVVAHVVRDWSSEGTTIRISLYDWCVKQFESFKTHRSAVGPVLVPGAGLGRLAWELATKLPHSVEAMESSIAMAAAANAILNRPKIQGVAINLHPYAVDPFSNEVHSSTRFQAVRIPDVDPTTWPSGSLSYTFGDFGYDSMKDGHKRYSAVVTCFFLDTATTLYDYISTIDAVLSARGIWVNVGPVHWHQNSQVPLAVDELFLVLKNYCRGTSGKSVFDILHWSVDQHPVGYRSDRRRQSTHHDAYYPLRFVLKKREP